jgi:hypothetical protein
LQRERLRLQTRYRRGQRIKDTHDFTSQTRAANFVNFGPRLRP